MSIVYLIAIFKRELERLEKTEREIDSFVAETSVRSERMLEVFGRLRILNNNRKIEVKQIIRDFEEVSGRQKKRAGRGRTVSIEERQAASERNRKWWAQKKQNDRQLTPAEIRERIEPPIIQ